MSIALLTNMSYFSLMPSNLHLGLHIQISNIRISLVPIKLIRNITIINQHIISYLLNDVKDDIFIAIFCD